MADDGSKQGTTWPLPKFYFKVTWDGTEISFQEVSGLDAETQIIEYRHGNSPVFSTLKMPGIAKYSNVTMKKGVFDNDDTYWKWYAQIKLNTIKRITVVIQLLDETGKAKQTWTLNNAWPTKITPTDVKSDGNEAAIESIEIAYETLKIEAA